jgi:iron complex transport system permease protein
MLRRLVGHEHGVLVPACVLGGGAFLALCDAAARTALAPAELPVGVVTALLGGPFFLWLLKHR